MKIQYLKRCACRTLNLNQCNVQEKAKINGCLKFVVVYGVGLCGLDDVTFVGDVHGLTFLWVEVHEPV